MNEQLIGDLFAESTRRMIGSSSREFSQKFAELIVRECADVGSKFSQAHPEDICYQIKRHFGVTK